MELMLPMRAHQSGMRTCERRVMSLVSLMILISLAVLCRTPVVSAAAADRCHVSANGFVSKATSAGSWAGLDFLVVYTLPMCSSDSPEKGILWGVVNGDNKTFTGRQGQLQYASSSSLLRFSLGADVTGEQSFSSELCFTSTECIPLCDAASLGAVTNCEVQTTVMPMLVLVLWVIPIALCGGFLLLMYIRKRAQERETALVVARSHLGSPVRHTLSRAAAATAANADHEAHTSPPRRPFAALDEEESESKGRSAALFAGPVSTGGLEPEITAVHFSRDTSSSSVALSDCASEDSIMIKKQARRHTHHRGTDITHMGSRADTLNGEEFITSDTNATTTSSSSSSSLSSDRSSPSQRGLRSSLESDEEGDDDEKGEQMPRSSSSTQRHERTAMSRSASNTEAEHLEGNALVATGAEDKDAPLTETVAKGVSEEEAIAKVSVLAQEEAENQGLQDVCDTQQHLIEAERLVKALGDCEDKETAEREPIVVAGNDDLERLEQVMQEDHDRIVKEAEEEARLAAEEQAERDAEDREAIAAAEQEARDALDGEEQETRDALAQDAMRDQLQTAEDEQARLDAEAAEEARLAAEEQAECDAEDREAIAATEQEARDALDGEEQETRDALAQDAMRDQLQTAEDEQARLDAEAAEEARLAAEEQAECDAEDREAIAAAEQEARDALDGEEQETRDALAQDAMRDQLQTAEDEQARLDAEAAEEARLAAEEQAERDAEDREAIAATEQEARDALDGEEQETRDALVQDAMRDQLQTAEDERARLDAEAEEEQQQAVVRAEETERAKIVAAQASRQGRRGVEKKIVSSLAALQKAEEQRAMEEVLAATVNYNEEYRSRMMETVKLNASMVADPLSADVAEASSASSPSYQAAREGGQDRVAETPLSIKEEEGESGGASSPASVSPPPYLPLAPQGRPSSFIGFSLAEVVRKRILVVDGLYKGGPAYQTGIRIGDTLEKIDGIPVHTIAEVRSAIQARCRCGRVTPMTLRCGSSPSDTGAMTRIGAHNRAINDNNNSSSNSANNSYADAVTPARGTPRSPSRCSEERSMQSGDEYTTVLWIMTADRRYTGEPYFFDIRAHERLESDMRRVLLETPQSSRRARSGSQTVAWDSSQDSPCAPAAAGGRGGGESELRRYSRGEAPSGLPTPMHGGGAASSLLHHPNSDFVVTPQRGLSGDVGYRMSLNTSPDRRPGSEEISVSRGLGKHGEGDSPDALESHLRRRRNS